MNLYLFGKEVNRLVNDMIYFIRDSIVAKTTEQVEDDHALNQVDLNTMYKMIDCINDTLVSMRFAINQNVHIEILIVKLTELIDQNNSGQTVSVSSNQNSGSSEVMDKIQQLEATIQQLAQTASVKRLNQLKINKISLVNNLSMSSLFVKSNVCLTTLIVMI